MIDFKLFFWLDQTNLLLGDKGALDTLGELLDFQIENPDSLQSSTTYVLACLSNMAINGNLIYSIVFYFLIYNSFFFVKKITKWN